MSPTLTVFDGIITQVNDIRAVLNRPEMRYMPSSVVRQWTPPANPYVKRWKPADVLRFSAQYRVMEALVRALHAAGVPLLVGSDCLVPAVVPGFSMHDEMHLMVLAGLSPYEVLKAATANAARFLGQAHLAGTVEVGKQADLLLLDANPMRDIATARRRAGLMLRGRWLPEAQLQAGLAAVVPGRQ